MIGQSGLGIGITMFLRDQFSGPAARVKGASKDLQRELAMLQQRGDQLRYTRNMSAGMALMGVAAMRGIGKALQRSADLRYELQFVQTITGATADQQKRMADTAKKLGESTMFYSQDVAEGMRFMGMAGMDAEEVLKNIEAATYLAGSTLSQIGGKGGSADIMTNVMKAFNIEASESIKVADMLSTAVTSSNTNLFDLGEALKYSASTAMDMGIPLHEATAMVMALGNAGMQGSMAGVAMENSMRYIARAVGSFGSGTQKKALDMIGLSLKDVTDESGNLLSMVDVMKKVGDAIENNFGAGMNVEKQSILQTLFGVRGKRAGSLFLRNLQEFEKFTHLVGEQSTGASGRIIQKQMEQLQGYILRVKSAWQNMMESFGYQLVPVAKALLAVLEVVLKTLRYVFDNKVLGPILSGAIAGFIIFKTVALAYRAVAAGIALVHNNAAISALVMGEKISLAWSRATAANLAYQAAARSSMMGAVRYSPGAFRGTGGYTAYIAGKGTRTFKSASAARAFAKSTSGAKVARGVGGLLAGGARTAGSMGGMALGLLGGPKGILLSLAIGALVTGISALVSASRRNKESLDENTNALTKSEDSFKNREIRAIEYISRNQDRILTLARESQRGPMTIEKFLEIQSKHPEKTMGGEIVQEVIPINVNVIVDGEIIDRKTEQYINKVTRR